MSTRTIFLAGAGGALAIALAAALVIAIWKPQAAPSRAPEATMGPADAAAPRPPEGGAVAPAAVVLTVPAAVPGDATEWGAVPISARPSQLGPDVAGPVLRGLDAARDRMDPCFTEEGQRLRAHPQKLADAGSGTPILLLSLETDAGVIVVVDAQVEAQGRATHQLLECCVRVLQGWRMPAPRAATGERFRLRHVLQ